MHEHLVTLYTNSLGPPEIPGVTLLSERAVRIKVPHLQCSVPYPCAAEGRARVAVEVVRRGVEGNRCLGTVNAA